MPSAQQAAAPPGAPSLTESTTSGTLQLHISYFLEALTQPPSQGNYIGCPSCQHSVAACSLQIGFSPHRFLGQLWGNVSYSMRYEEQAGELPVRAVTCRCFTQEPANVTDKHLPLSNLGSQFILLLLSIKTKQTLATLI